MRDFKDLAVWQRSHRVTLQVYRATRDFPKDELFGLTSQVRKSASSIGANIAEGCGRTQGDFNRFLQIAFGSASETQYHLLLACDLGYLERDVAEELDSAVCEVKRMLTALMRKVGNGKS